MSKHSHLFKLNYDLTSTEDHTISAEVLGNSLINMSALIKESDKVLNGEASTVEVEVKAHRESSFEIEVVAWLMDGGIDVLRTLGITATGAAVGAANFFAAVKAFKNRKVRAKAQQANGDWQITFEDNETVVVDKHANVLLENHSIRSKLDNVINKPTADQEFAKVSFKTVDETGTEVDTLVVTKDESEYFKSPPKKLFAVEHSVEENKNIVFTVISLEKKTGWKVKLPDGEEVAVKIEDEGFMERINARQDSFIKGDMFEVKMKTVTKEIDGKVNTTRSIMQVKRHRVAKDRKIIQDEPRG